MSAIKGTAGGPVTQHPAANCSGVVLLFIERTYEDYDPDDQQTATRLEILRFENGEDAQTGLKAALAEIAALPEEIRDFTTAWVAPVSEFPAAAARDIRALVRSFE